MVFPRLRLSVAAVAAAGSVGVLHTANSEKQSFDVFTRNKQSFKVERGLIREIHTNWYPANNPIEDTNTFRLQLKQESGSLFGVFDGHSGGSASAFCRDDLFDILEYKSKESKSAILSPSAFTEADEIFLQTALLEGRKRDGNAGACAVVCHVDGQNLTTAWVGDCRAVLGKSSIVTPLLGSYAVEELTRDHQIKTNPDEKARLVREHPGEMDIIIRGRVKGRLEPTRAFGDGKYKMMEYFKDSHIQDQYRITGWTPPYVTSEPEISHRKLNRSHKFLVLGCDGLFEDLTSQQVVDGVSEFLRTPEKKRGGHNAASWLTEKAMRAAAESVYSTVSSDKILEGLTELPLGRMRRRYHDDITVQVVFFDHDSRYAPQVPSGKPISEPNIITRFRAMTPPTKPVISSKL